MCGRFTLRTPVTEIVKQFKTVETPLFDLAVRYNIAPTQTVVVVRARGDQRELALMRWGLIPSWAKDTKMAYSTINARADTLATKPAFRTAFKKRRCLIVADGYYEWLREGKTKQPYLYELHGGRPFAFAGLWEQWWGPDSDKSDSKKSATESSDGAPSPPLESCTIVTTDANSLAQKIHDRMPVLLAENDYSAWLDPTNQDTESLRYLFEPFPPDDMSARPVNTFVNNARNEGPECIANSA